MPNNLQTIRRLEALHKMLEEAKNRKLRTFRLGPLAIEHLPTDLVKAIEALEKLNAES